MDLLLSTQDSICGLGKRVAITNGAGPIAINLRETPSPSQLGTIPVGVFQPTQTLCQALLVDSVA